MNEASTPDPAPDKSPGSKYPDGNGEGSKTGGGWRTVLLLIGAVAVFLAGFAPMWLKSREQAARSDAVLAQVTVIERDRNLARLETSIAAGALDARRGEYEAARQYTSQFFQSLQDEMDRGIRSDLTTAQRQELRSLLDMRDDLITLLARSDPACAERLMEVYLTARKALHSP